MQRLYINTDGGSRGNPGPAAIGIVIYDEKGFEIHHHKECIGIATNNEAEYSAILKALTLVAQSKWIKENSEESKEIICRLDSQLVVEQICGRYKIKKDHIRDFILKIKEITNQLDTNITFIHIPREENKAADKLVNQALDECSKK